MIYTSYFAKTKKIPTNILQISISAKPPTWFNGVEFKKLAPPYNLLMDYKCNRCFKDEYIKRYKAEVLNKFTQMEILKELHEIGSKYHVGEINIALMCYEKSSDFCHRHIVAEWLNESGFGVKELEL